MSTSTATATSTDASTSTPSIPDWKGITPESLDIPSDVAKASDDTTTVDVEPSGMTVLDGALFVVSDSGVLLRAAKSAPTTWVSQFVPATGKENDYESITRADGKLMIGVEGFNKDGDYKLPHILRFAPSSAPSDYDLGTFTGSKWKLADYDTLAGDSANSNSGMEGLTFVPDGSYPTAWLLHSPNNSSGDASYRPAYGGLFFVATQAEPGTIRVYDLPQGDENNVTSVSSMGSITKGLKSDLAISDLFFDGGSSRLFVLYDGSGDVDDTLQVVTIGTASKSVGDGHELSAGGTSSVPYEGAEGICVIGDDVYLCIDLSGSQQGSALGDGVWKFAGLRPLLAGAG